MIVTPLLWAGIRYATALNSQEPPFCPTPHATLFLLCRTNPNSGTVFSTPETMGY